MEEASVYRKCARVRAFAFKEGGCSFMLHTVIEPSSHVRCAILGLGHPAMHGTGAVSSHVEVCSRWETVGKGTDEMSFEAESCLKMKRVITLEREQQARRSCTWSLLVRTHNARRRKKAAAQNSSVAGPLIHSFTHSFSTFTEHLALCWQVFWMLIISSEREGQ